MRPTQLAHKDRTGTKEESFDHCEGLPSRSRDLSLPARMAAKSGQFEFGSQRVRA